jgi:hypothetical protein
MTGGRFNGERMLVNGKMIRKSQFTRFLITWLSVDEGIS